MTRTIEDRHDSTGMKIQLNDVLKDEETGEMALVVFASNKSGVRGLAIENKIIGSGDWLDVFPDGVWTIVGNAEERNLNAEEYSYHCEKCNAQYFSNETDLKYCDSDACTDKDIELRGPYLIES